MEINQDEKDIYYNKPARRSKTKEKTFKAAR
jgi:hypothetical protein